MVPAPKLPERQAERRFARTVLALISLGFALVLLAGLSALMVMMRSEDLTRWVDHTYQVEREVSGIRLSLEQMRSARRAVLLRMPTNGVRYDEAHDALLRSIANAARLTADNPVQQRNVARLRQMSATLDGLFRTSLGPSPLRAAEADQQLLALSARVEALALEMAKIERALLAERDVERDRSVGIFYGVLTLTAVLLLLVGIGSIWVIRRYTGDLQRSRDELRTLNENLEEAVAERTTDLQRANDEIQRFAYIVSHDLRSPLVNVMGFTSELDAAIAPLRTFVEKVGEEAPDLVEDSIRLSVEEDLPEAIGFIRTSTEKMDRLINAILRLSRQGRRTLSPERIELGRLAEGIVDALRHRIDELGVDVTVDPDLPTIVSDRLALEQILSNLVENAIKYLKPGRPGEVRVGGHEAHGRVLISVRDNGRGIDRRDHDRIFDLFRRSGPQDQPGEGIGLAHVRALAYRLGGTISVESELDRGATFTINLPPRLQRGARSLVMKGTAI